MVMFVSTRSIESQREREFGGQNKRIIHELGVRRVILRFKVQSVMQNSLSLFFLTQK